MSLHLPDASVSEARFRPIVRLSSRRSLDHAFRAGESIASPWLSVVPGLLDESESELSHSKFVPTRDGKVLRFFRLRLFGRRARGTW